MSPAQATADGRTADPLSDALLYLAAHHGRAISRDALVAGLPLEEGRLSAGLFARAAQRAGLETEPVKRAIPDIPALVLPAVLVMRDGSTRILLALDTRKGAATILDPTTGEAPRQISVGELSLDYLGYGFFVRPAVTADARTMAAGDVPRAHWFWSVVRRFWSNYSHVAIAALLVNMLGLAAPLFIMSVYDRVIPNGAIPSLIALSIGMVIAISFEFVLRMVRSRIIDMTGKKIDVVLAANIFEHVLAVKMAQRPPSVGILANQMREFDSVREFFTSGSVVSATDLLFAVLFVACSVHDRGPARVDPAGDAADHDRHRVGAAVSARPRDAPPAGGIGRAARRPGRVAVRHRDRARNRRRSPHAERLGALGRRHRPIGRGCSLLVVAGTDHRQ